MTILESLVPNIRELSEKYEIPVWEDWTRPWELLDTNLEGNLQSQIMELISISDSIGVPDDVCISEERGRVFIHPDAIIGRFVKIEGPSFIGPMCQLNHCALVRAGSWISKGCVVGHSTEIKNSLMLPNSNAPHFNYVGDSIIGPNSNLGAGVKIANLRNDRRSVMLRFSTGSIDTRMKKLGALIGSDVSIGCNSVLNPGAIIYPNSSIPPNSTISDEYDF